MVTSLFSEQPKGNLDDKFKHSLEFKEANSKVLEKYNERFDFIELGKLAIDYSDGIVKVNDNVNDDLLKYAQANDKPVFNHSTAEEAQNDYTTFYNKLLG